MSDETQPPPKPPAAKRAPRRRTTPAKAASTPKPKRPKATGQRADGEAEVTASPAKPAAAPSRPRRRKAAPPVAAPATAKRNAKAAGDAGAVESESQKAVAPKNPRARRVKAEVPVGAPLQQGELAAALPLADDGVAEPAGVAEVAAEEQTAAAPIVDDDSLGLALGESPVDLPGAARDEAGGLRWASAILVMTSPLLLVFNSHAIDNWARQLPVNPWSGPVIDAAIGWHATMQRIGFAAPVDVGRAGWKQLKGEPS